MSRRRKDPSPAEIARACAAIRATWSPAERAARCQVPGPVPWTLPVCPCPAWARDFEPAEYATASARESSYQAMTAGRPTE